MELRERTRQLRHKENFTACIIVSLACSDGDERGGEKAGGLLSRCTYTLGRTRRKTRKKGKGILGPCAPFSCASPADQVECVAWALTIRAMIRYGGLPWVDCGSALQPPCTAVARPVATCVACVLDCASAAGYPACGTCCHHGRCAWCVTLFDGNMIGSNEALGLLATAVERVRRTEKGIFMG
eukprot:1156632-Pelagomonas_calceolata.AAC.12